MLGGIACDLGKRGYSAAKEKAKELGEKMKETNHKAQEENDRRGQLEKEHVPTGKWRGDPEDKSFLMSYGWLYIIWWLCNVVDTLLCMWWFSCMMDSHSTRGMAWIPIVVWLFSLLFNRLAYEGGVALFEMVRHLRQIRDELRRQNMRETQMLCVEQEAAADIGEDSPCADEHAEDNSASN